LDQAYNILTETSKLKEEQLKQQLQQLLAEKDQASLLSRQLEKSNFELRKEAEGSRKQL
jgi:hypothetical protein